MARGSKTSAAKQAQFRAHYLYSGNAEESARKVKLAPSTGHDLARKLAATKEFVAARRKLRDQYLDELVAARMRVVRTAVERFEGDLPIPEPSEDSKGGPPIVIIDKRADYGKLVLDAEKNAHNLAKLDAGIDEEGKAKELEPLVVEVRMTGAAKKPKPDGGA
jgi:hypothetical protein